MRNTKYTKELLEPIVKESKSIKDVLIKLNLKPNGMYGKLKILMNKYGLKIERTYSGKYTKDVLEPIVKESNSVSEVLRKLNLKPVGATHVHMSKLIKKWGLDTSHFTGQAWNKNIKNYFIRSSDDVLIERKEGIRTKTTILRRALLDIGREHICEVCKQLPIWNNKPLVLQIDHINGNWLNDKRDNLRFICPNCHSQTEGYRKRK